jgi:hypothetical protein
MGIKKSVNMMSLMAIAMASEGYMDKEFFEETTPNKRVTKNKKVITPIPKGMKEFYYGEVLILALNQKNADRKAAKKGLI